MSYEILDKEDTFSYAIYNYELRITNYELIISPVRSMSYEILDIEDRFSYAVYNYELRITNYELNNIPRTFNVL